MSILLNTKPGAHYRLRHPLKSELVRCSWARNKCALLCSRSMQRLLMLSLHVQPRGSIHLPYTRGGTSVLLFCVKNNALLQSLSSFDFFRSTTNCKAFSSSVHFLLHGPGPSSFPFRWRCWAARRRRRPATAWTGRGCGCQQHPYRVPVVLFGLSSTNLANFDH